MTIPVTLSSQPPSTPTALRHAVVAAAFVASYVLLDWLSYLHPVQRLGITAWNPQAALLLGFLLRFGLRHAPVTVLGPWLSEVVLRGAGGLQASAIAGAASITVVYTAAAWTLAELRVAHELSNARDVSITIGTCVVAALGVALLYCGVVVVSGELPVTLFTSSVLQYWVGDANALIVLLPAFMLLGPVNGAAALRVWRMRGVEIAAQFTFTLAVLWIVFGTATDDRFRMFYLLFMPVVWIALRWGVRGAVLAVMLVQVGLLIALETGAYPSGSFVDFQLRMIALAGTGLLLAAVVTEREISAQTLREKDALLSQTRQFAAAGELASAIAHELNNPIAALQNYLRSARLLTEPNRSDPATLRLAVERALDEAERAADVLRRLRNYFSSGGHDSESLDLGRIIGDAVATLQGRLDRAGIRCQISLPASLPNVVADRVHVSIVVQNLIANACDALEGAHAPNPTISIDIDAAGEMVRVRVADNGPGVSDDLEGRVFDPFTTTRPDGMGLGLAISRSLLQANGGKIWLEQTRGRGASFGFELPVTAVARKEPERSAT